MIRILATSVLAILTSASIATASPFFWDKTESTVTPPTNCTNFAGEYRGACSSARHGNYDKTIHIQQDGCELLRIRGMSLYISGLFSASYSIPAIKNRPARVKSGSVSLQWDKDRKDLLLTAVGVRQTLGGTEMLKVKRANGEMKLDGNKLTINLSDEKGKSLASCSLIKQ